MASMADGDSKQMARVEAKKPLDATKADPDGIPRRIAQED